MILKSSETIMVSEILSYKRIITYDKSSVNDCLLNMTLKLKKLCTNAESRIKDYLSTILFFICVYSIY